MSIERGELIRSVFLEALGLQGIERSRLLDERCGQETELRRDVESLLAHNVQGSPFLEAPAVHLTTPLEQLSSTKPLWLENPGDQIGTYRLERVVGEGTFGTVWLAERQAPFVQTVAIKIIKPGMDSRAVITRFEQERQSLAVMDHPNVARVMDGGMTPHGRPYFVMEYVEGEPITEHADRKSLGVVERLKLFGPVCEAVQHAHTKGIIHRDLKPSNILVTERDGEAIPKVIDFGVAKSIEPLLGVETIFTEDGRPIGTVEYMSPEQASGGTMDIDTRTDVYALGVVLYELLTGKLPFDSTTLRAAASAKAWAELQRIVREVEPSKPSTRVIENGNVGSRTSETDAIPEARKPPTLFPSADPRSLSRKLRGDLDWVVMRCLEKDRSRRYATPTALAEELARYLRNEPVEAGPPSASNRIAKFVSRNKGPVTAALAVFGALLLGLAGTLWNAAEARHAASSARLAELEQRRLTDSESAAKRDALAQKQVAEHQRDEADAARQRADAINEFVTQALKSSDPNQGGNQSVTVVQAMTQALADLDNGSLSDEPATLAQLLRTIATILNGNGRSFEAKSPAVRALAIERSLHTGDDPNLALSLQRLASVQQSLGQMADAESLYSEALEMYRRLFTGDHLFVARSLNNVAVARQFLGRMEEAEPLYAESLAMRQRLYSGDNLEVATGLNNLACIRQALGRDAEAEPLFVQALEMRQRLLNGDHPDIAHSLNYLGLLRKDLGRPAEAETLFVKALEIRRRLYKGDHPAVATTLSNLALARQALGRAAEAEPLYVEALQMRQRLFPDDHPDVAQSLNNLAFGRRAMGRAEEAEPLYAQALEMNRRLYKGDHPSLAMCLNNLGFVRLLLGRAAEAEPLLVEALEMRRRLFKGDHKDIVLSLSNLARARQALDKATEAQGNFEEAVDMQRRLSPSGSQGLARLLWQSGSARLDNGDAIAALSELEEAAAMAQKFFPSDHKQVRECLKTLAKCRTEVEAHKGK